MSRAAGARIAGVVGWPVAHSRSPLLHRFWLERHGIDGAYVPFAVSPDNLADALRALPVLGIVGVNVTIPHKEAAFAVVDSRDAAAERTGAVNTVVVRDRRLFGSNSDGFGFLENLRAGAPAWDSAAAPAVVLGAGGAARAVVAALLDAGVPGVRIANRTAARADALARDLGGPVEPVDWRQRSRTLAGAGLLVNATALGMDGKPQLDIDLAALPGWAVVTDLVYAPLETRLLRAARARGCVAVDGLGMLFHQGRPGFAAWFGVDPEVTPELRSFVLDAVARPAP